MNPSTTNSPRVYVDPQELFSLHVPEGWLVDSSGQQNTRVILLHPTTEANFRVNVNVTVQELRALTPDEFLTMSRLQLKQLTGSPRAERDEPAERRGGGHRLESTMTLGAVTIETRQLIVLDGGKAYVVTATAPAGSAANYQREFEVVFESFQLR